MKKAVMIVSGGMDSMSLLDHYWRNQIEISSVVSFNYGQNHKKELEFVKGYCSSRNIKHRVIDLWSAGVTDAISGSSALIGGEIPEGHYAAENMSSTVVPGRNLMMISIAAAIAEAEGADTVVVGTHAGDHHIYPDCRPEFNLDANNAVYASSDGKVTLGAPFAYSSKADIALLAIQNDFDLSETWSCYKGGEIHCGRCGTCVERLEAIAAAVQTHYHNTGNAYLDLTKYEDTDYWKTQVEEK